MSGARGRSVYRSDDGYHRSDARPPASALYSRNYGGPPPRDLFPERARHMRESQQTSPGDHRDSRDIRDLGGSGTNSWRTPSGRDRRDSRFSQDNSPQDYAYDSQGRRISPRASTSRRASNASSGSLPPRRRSHSPPYYAQKRAPLPRSDRPRPNYGDNYRAPDARPSPLPQNRQTRSPDLIRRPEPNRIPRRDFYTAQRPISKEVEPYDDREHQEKGRHDRDQILPGNRKGPQVNPGVTSVARRSLEPRASYPGPSRVDSSLSSRGRNLERRVSAPDQSRKSAPTERSPVDHATSRTTDSELQLQRRYSNTCESIAQARPLAAHDNGNHVDVQKKDANTTNRELSAAEVAAQSPPKQEFVKETSEGSYTAVIKSEEYINPFDLLDDTSSVDESRPSTALASHNAFEKRKEESLSDTHLSGPIEVVVPPDEIPASNRVYDALQSTEARTESHQGLSFDVVAEMETTRSRTNSIASEASTIHLNDPQAKFSIDNTRQSLSSSSADVQNTNDQHSHVTNITQLVPIPKIEDTDHESTQHENDLSRPNEERMSDPTEELLSIVSDMDDLRSSASSRAQTPATLEQSTYSSPKDTDCTSRARVVNSVFVQHSSPKSNNSPTTVQNNQHDSSIPNTVSGLYTIDTQWAARSQEDLAVSTDVRDAEAIRSIQSAHEEELPSDAESGEVLEDTIEQDDFAKESNRPVVTLTNRQSDSTQLAAHRSASDDSVKAPSMQENNTSSAIINSAPEKQQRISHDKNSAKSMVDSPLYTQEAEVNSQVIQESTVDALATASSMSHETFPSPKGHERTGRMDTIEASRQDTEENNGDSAGIAGATTYEIETLNVLADDRTLPAEEEVSKPRAEEISELKQQLAQLDVEEASLRTKRAKTTSELLSGGLKRRNLPDYLPRRKFCAPFDPNLSSTITIENKGRISKSFNLIRRFDYREPQDYKFYAANLELFEHKQSRIVALLRQKQVTLLREEEAIREEYMQRHKRWLKHTARCDRQRLVELQQEENEAATINSSLAPSRGTRNKPVGFELKEAMVGIELPNNLLNEAAIPRLIHNPIERDLYSYVDFNELVETPLEYYNITTEDPKEIWSEDEQAIFSARYKLTPKQFGVIAAGLPNRTAQECVLHYYKSKKSLDYRASGKPKTKPSSRGRGRAKKVAVARTSRRQILATVSAMDADEEEPEEEIVEVKSLRKRRAITDIDDTSRKTRTQRKTVKRGPSEPSVVSMQPPATQSVSPSMQPRAIMSSTPQSSKQGQSTTATKISVEQPGRVAKHPQANPATIPVLASQPKGYPDAVMDDRRRSWSAQDESLFVDQLKRFGTDYHAISSQMPSKSADQIQRHFNDNLVERGYRQYLPRPAGSAPRPLLSNDYLQHNAALPSSSQQYTSRTPVLNAPLFGNNQYSNYAPLNAPSYSASFSRPATQSSISFYNQAQHNSPQNSGYNQPNLNYEYRNQVSARAPYDSRYESGRPERFEDRPQEFSRPPERFEASRMPERYENSRPIERTNLPPRGSIDSMLNSGERVQLPPIGSSRGNISDNRFHPYYNQQHQQHQQQPQFQAPPTFGSQQESRQGQFGSIPLNNNHNNSNHHHHHHNSSTHHGSNSNSNNNNSNQSRGQQQWR